MAKKTSDNVMDALLAAIAAGNQMTVNAGEPANRADAVGNALAVVSLTPGDGNGDFVIGAGPGAARQLDIAEQADIPVTGAGTQTGDHVSIVSATDLLLVTTSPGASLTNGEQVTVSTFSHIVAQPT